MARTDNENNDRPGGDEGARALRALRDSLIGRSDLPYRPRAAEAELAALPEEQRQTFYALGLQRAEAVLRDASDQVRTLGKLRYRPAVPTLIELWEHSLGSWRVEGAGAALLAIGTPEALAALRARIDDEDRSVRARAIDDLFTACADEDEAWASLSWLFTPERLAASSGVRAAWEVLAHLCDSGPGPQYDLVSADRRWLDLCVSLRHHRVLAEVARAALRDADPEVTGPVLDEVAEAARAERERQAPALVSGSLLRRYQRGEHQAVWRELAAAGPLSDAWRAEAEQVAAATMERVRDNAGRLARALRDQGWPFPASWLDGPDPETETAIRELERRLGVPLPPALTAFWRVAGSIDFVPAEGGGSWPERARAAGVPEGLRELDPLEIRGAAVLAGEFRAGLDDRGEVHPEAAFADLGVCRDGALKAGEDGATIPVRLPFAGADPVVDDGAELSFTDYLRRAFGGKGFLEDYCDLDVTDQEHDELRRWLAGVDFKPVGF